MKTATRRSSIGVLATLLSITLSPTLFAAEAVVNTTIAGDQIRPKVAISETGSFVVTWKGPNPIDQSGAYIGQRYDALNSPIGDEFIINPVVIGGSGPTNHGIAMRSDGVFYTVANDTVQAYAADATPSNVPSELDIYKGSINAPDRLSETRGIASNIYGETVSVFQTYFVSGTRRYGIIHTQRFDTLGNSIGERQQIHNSFVERRTPSIAISNNGQYGVVWSGTVGDEGYETPARGNIYASLYNADGSATLQEFSINQDPEGSYKYDPDIAFDNDGNFVVVWKTLKGEIDKIYARLFDNTGTALGDEFLVHDDTLLKNTTPSVAMRYDGQFVIVWDNGDNLSNGRDIFGRHFDAAGVALAPAFTVNTTIEGKQVEPDVAINAEGKIIFTWASEDQDGDLFDIIANVQAHPSPSVKPTTSTPPLAFAGPDQTVLENSSVQLDASSSFDPYGTITSYFWNQTAGDPVMLSNTNTASPQFTAPDNTTGTDITLTFEVTATNSISLSDTDTVAIIVQDSPPIADAGDDFRVNFNAIFSLSASGSYDPDDGTIDDYRWSVVNDASDNVDLLSTTGVEVTAQKFNSGANTPYLIVAGQRVNRTSTFEVVATDNDGLEGSDQVTVSYNMPPEAAITSDTIIYPGQQVTLDGSASSDYDGTLASYTWEQTSGESVTLADENQAITTFVPGLPSTTQTNTLRFTFTVRDNEGAADSKTVELLLKTADNQPPNANAGQDVEVLEQTLVSLSGLASTDNGTVEGYEWRQLDNGAPTVVLSSTTIAEPTFTAPEVDAFGAQLVFELRAIDDENFSATDQVTVTVTNVNQAPIADAGSDASFVEQSAVSLNGSGSQDADDNLTDYLWTQMGGPTVNLSLTNIANPTFTAPEVDGLGVTLTFRLTVTDSEGLVDTDTVTITIFDTNQAPFANAGLNVSVIENGSVLLNGSGSTDPNGNISTYQWLQTNTGFPVTLSSATDERSVFTAPEVGSSGATLTFELTVTDTDGLSDSSTVVITIIDSDTNQPPLADAGANVSAEEGTTVLLRGDGSTDPDNNINRYEWNQISGPDVTLSNATGENTLFTAPEVDSTGATLTFELTVVDDGNLSATSQVTVTVTDAGQISGGNQRPEAEAGNNITVTEGNIVPLSGLGSSDIDGTVIGFEWLQIDGPGVVLSSTTDANIAFTAPAVNSSGVTLIFHLTVTDNGGETATDTVNVRVLDSGQAASNQTPVANAGEDFSAQEQSDVTLNGSVSDDPDGSIAGYSWNQIDGPTVTLSSSSEERPSFTAPEFDSANAVLTFELIVTDDQGQSSAADSITVTVTETGSTPAAATSSGGGGGSFAWTELLFLLASGSLVASMRRRRQD